MTLDRSTDRVAQPAPGPWATYPDPINGNIRILAGTLIVANTGRGTMWAPEMEANAHLIAAAPTLLEVCELALAFHGADTEAFVARDGHGMTTKDLCDHIRAAIAKATGVPS